MLKIKEFLLRLKRIPLKLTIPVIVIVLIGVSSGIFIHIKKNRIPEKYFSMNPHELMKSGKYEDALMAFSAQIEKSGGEPDDYYNRGTAYLTVRNFDRAIKDLTEAIGKDNENPHYYINRANAFFLKGDYDSAVSDNTQVISKMPENHLGYFNRGRAYYMKGDVYPALKDFEMAYSLGAVNAKQMVDEIKKNTGM